MREMQARFDADAWIKSKIGLPEKFNTLKYSGAMKYFVPKIDVGKSAVEMCQDPLVLELMRTQGYRPRVSMH